MKSFFFQNTVSANPKIHVAMPMPSLEIVFWKRTVRKYLDIYAYTHICEKLSTKVQSLNLASSFSGMALNAFLKRTLYIYIYIYKTLFHMYSKTSPSYHLHRSTTPLYRSLLNIIVMILYPLYRSSYNIIT